MAFDMEYLQNQLWDQFSFFQDGGADGGISEAMDHQRHFKLAEIRLHVSSPVASVTYFVARLNSIKGSAHDIILISQAMSGVQDLHIYYSDPLFFLSGDIINFSMDQASGVNVWGLNAIGWAVQAR